MTIDQGPKPRNYKLVLNYQRTQGSGVISYFLSFAMWSKHIQCYYY